MNVRISVLMLLVLAVIAQGFEGFGRRRQRPRRDRGHREWVKTREGHRQHRGHHRRTHERVNNAERSHQSLGSRNVQMSWGITDSDQVANASRWLTDMVAPWMRGNVNVGPDVNVNWDLGELFGLGGGPNHEWWRGPNVCQHRDEREEDIPGISTHTFSTTSSCDQTESAYRCKAEVSMGSKKRIYIMSYECCHGYQRVQGQGGCPRELNLKEITKTVEDIGATEFSKVLESVGLDRMLTEANYTIFAPTDEKFKQYEPPRDLNNNIVIVSPETMYMSQQWRQLLMSHIIPDIVQSGNVQDEQTLTTANRHAKIRINFYNTPRRMMTANCKEVLSPDNQAENGVVHVVDGVLEPAEDTLSDMISARPDLSMLKTLIGRVGLNPVLKEKGQFTVFAPTNRAFEALNDGMMEKLIQGDTCLNNLIKNHVLPNVICSSVIAGKVRTVNLLDRYVNLTRTSDDKIFVEENAQLVIKDVMATNGVLHIIDKVIIPDASLDILDVVDKAGGSGFLQLVRNAGLGKRIQDLANFTLFMPTNAALEALPQEIKDELKRDRVALEKVIKYHIATAPQTCAQLRNNEQLETLDSNKKIVIREYASAPFGLNQKKTAQCAPITDTDYLSCDAVTHIISQVMLPPKGDIYDTLSQDQRFSRLVELMKVATLSEELQLGGPYTFLAPTNEALEKLDNNVLQSLRQDPDKLKSFLQHHIILGQLCCAGIFDSQALWKQKEQTLDGRFVSVSRYRGSVIADRDSTVTQCDITATNGVVHAIDEVLQSAADLYISPGRRGPGLFGGRGDGLGGRMTNFHRNLRQVWDMMRDWDWDVDMTWQPFRRN